MNRFFHKQNNFNLAWSFTKLIPINNEEEVANYKPITASCGIVLPDKNTIVAIYNCRGWDIPRSKRQLRWW